jgi:hypothetical protein
MLFKILINEIINLEETITLKDGKGWDSIERIWNLIPIKVKKYY